MKSQSSDTSREPAAKRSEPAVPSRVPAQAGGPDKALNEAGAMGNQAFQRRGRASKEAGGSASAAAEPAPAPLTRDDPEAILARLGEGKPLDSEARRRMEAVFGEDFSGVRLHDDATAALLASDFDARAFTVGEHVALGGGGLEPGTAVGDAVLAHELAHVLQQRGGAPGAEKEDAAGSSFLERDADQAAASATASLWTGAQGAGTGITPVDKPSGRSGLRLSRCDGGKPKPAPPAKKSVTVKRSKLHGSTYDIDSGFDYANTKVYNQVNVEVKKGKEENLDEAKTTPILGDDLILEEFSDPKAPTEEEKKLFKVNQATDEITAYFVKGLSAGSTGEQFRPAHGHSFVGLVVSNDGNDPTFAHELGHILLDDGGHDVPDDTYLMFGSKTAGKHKLTEDQKTKILASKFVK